MSGFEKMKQALKHVLRSPFGHGISRTLEGLGATRLSALSSRYTRYAPEEIPVVVPCSGGTSGRFVMAGAGGDDNVAFSLWCHGLEGYEPPFPSLYARLAMQSGVIVGVGANSGLYELIAAASSAIAAIYSFEPFPPAIELLERNIALNGFEERIEVLKMAVSNTVGEQPFHVPAKTHGTILETSSSLNPAFRPEHHEVLTVATTTLDHFAEERGIECIDLLHIDVESMEHAVLAGAVQVLKSHRPFVLIEVLEESDCDALEQLRADSGYSSFWIDGSTFRLQSRLVCRLGAADQLLCPEERCEELAGLLADAGLGIQMAGTSP